MENLVFNTAMVTIVPEAVAGAIVEATVSATVVVMAICILDGVHQWKVECR